MDTTQIYSIVNSLAGQTLGSTALTVVDNQGLISLGNTILTSDTNTDAFLNALNQMIGKSIYSYRKYTNKFSDYLVDDFKWGAILRKTKASMPAAEADQSFDLADGGTVDHYKIAKPKVKTKLFVTRSPYQFHVTTQTAHLEEAFRSAEDMAAFLSTIRGEVQNKIELSMETLGRNALTNMFAENQGTAREIKLITNYQTATGAAEALTPQESMYDPDFLRYAIAQINLMSDYLTDMSDQYNDGTETRHTPYDKQRIKVLSQFEQQLRTVVQYSAFNERMVEIGSYEKVNFWQARQTPTDINVNRASDGTAKHITGIVASIHDIDALGTYKKTERVRTTPENAAGLYFNTYWHEQQLWFNDTSENFVYFTLA